MIKRIFLIFIILVITLFAFGCEQANEIEEDKPIKTMVFNEDISKDEQQFFIIGSKIIEEFFNVECESEKFLKTDIQDMEQYAIVTIPTKLFFFTVRISYDDMKVFDIDSELYAFAKFLDEKVDDYSPSNNIDYSMYKYKKTPINEKYAKRITEDFIKDTPLANTHLMLKEVKYEYKYDSQEIEYYIFQYNYVNEEYRYDTVYIKVDTYMRKVVRITK